MTDTSDHPDHATAARRFVRAHHAGVLSTLSKRLQGMPFGSIAPFVLDHDGSPVVLISALAEHTKNLGADPRCSILAHPCAQDAQAAGRVTLLGRAARVDDPAQARTIGARYLRIVPEAAGHIELGDFRFYRIAVEAVRFIGGFGRIHWVDASDFAPPANSVGADEDALIARLNAGEAEALRECCARVHGVTAPVQAVGVDVDGIDIRADGRALRLDFSSPACDAAAALAAFRAVAEG